MGNGQWAMGAYGVVMREVQRFRMETLKRF
jgi:hypothetical protein